MKPQGGIALIWVAGLLSIATMTVALFVTLAATRRYVSRYAVDHAHSRLLAHSGMERAVCELTRGAIPSYGGEDYDGNGILSPPGSVPERTSQIFRPGALDIESCPIEFALRPSLFSRADGELDLSGANAPDRTVIDGVEMGYSGRVRGTHVDLSRRIPGIARSIRGNTYALKIEDESAKINVNGGFLDEGNRDNDTDIVGNPLLDHRDPDVAMPDGERRGWNHQLARILDRLGEVREIDLNGDGAVQEYEEWDVNGILDPAPIGIVSPPWPKSMGQLILENRPVGGYRMIEEVRQMLDRFHPAGSPPVPDLAAYLTVHSWIDTKVIRPNAWRQTISMDPSDTKKVRGELKLEEGGRPPVNLNAAHRGVLISLLQGISAQADVAAIHRVGTTFDATRIWNVSPVQAGRIAERIVQRRKAVGGFPDWALFGSFLESLVLAPVPPEPAPAAISGFTPLTSSGGPTGAGQIGPADMILANFNPNTHSKLQYPDTSLWRWVDKTDLLANSTEGGVCPTGSFRISCAGRVVDPSGRKFDETVVETMMEAYAPNRHTTQRDFVARRTPVLEDPPGSGEYYLSRTTGEVRTTGASAGDLWWGGTPPIDVGLAAMTYPCPMTAVNAGNPSDTDGYLGLATVEIRGPSPTAFPGAITRFLHHFDDSWDADVGVADPARKTGPVDLGPTALARPDELFQVGTAGAVWPSPPEEPNTLLPDGAQLQHNRCPSYSAMNLPEDEIGSDHGVFCYWVKRPVGSDQPDFSCIRYNGPPPYTGATESQVLLMGGGVGSGGILFEILAAPHLIDTVSERLHKRQPSGLRGPGIRWRMQTAFFDTDEPYGSVEGHDLHSHLYGFFPSAVTEPLVYPTGVNASLGRSIKMKPGTPDLDPDLRFVLGGRIFTSEPTRARPYHLLDELVICDFGDSAPMAHDLCDRWSEELYGNGRYYNDGAFLSALIRPDPSGPSRIVSVQWSGHLPTDMRWDPWGAGYLPRPIDPILSGNDGTGRPRLRLEIELLDGSTAFLQRLSQGERVNRAVNDFRYRVRLGATQCNPVTGLDDPLNQPLLETPFLDDITFLCQRAAGCKTLSWGVRE